MTRPPLKFEIPREPRRSRAGPVRSRSISSRGPGIRRRNTRQCRRDKPFRNL